MCSHYLVDPVACTPASGWEKGQVEDQVGLVRERFFTPRLRFKTYEEMNAWLLDKCIAYAKAHHHPGTDRANDLGSVRGRAPEADIELTGVVTDDGGVGQKVMGFDAAPQGGWRS
jgi:hypothetical protein